MPASRPADYYLGYLDGCVFLDFDNVEDDKICLVRISFDGYGCCGLEDHRIPLSIEDSKKFKDILQNNISDQEELLKIVKRAVVLNKENILADALEEYELI